MRERERERDTAYIVSFRTKHWDNSNYWIRWNCLFISVAGLTHTDIFWLIRYINVYTLARTHKSELWQENCKKPKMIFYDRWGTVKVITLVLKVVIYHWILHHRTKHCWPTAPCPDPFLPFRVCVLSHFVIPVALCNKSVTLCNTCRTL